MSHEGVVGAFFDLDGTLVPEPSLERRFFSGLRQSGAIPIGNYLRWSWSAIRLLPSGLAGVRNSNKQYLHGIRADQIFQHIAEIRFFEEAVERVAWHARQGHCVVLMSGTLAPLAYLVAVALGCELEARGVDCPMSVRATALEEEHGKWTGKILGPAMFGEAKCVAMKKFAAERGMGLAESYAYGNSLADGPMLAAAGRAQVINPGKDMAAMANRQNWPIWHWHQEKRLVPASGKGAPVKIRRVEGHA
jgi:HAD superfamily hydrolase (TIGR01490 family)